MFMSTRPNRAVTGLLMAAAGAILFASKGLFSKALFLQGVDYQTLTVLRALLALPLFAALAVHRGLRLRALPPRAVAQACFAGVLCYTVGALIDFHALELIDISLERALLFSYPAMVVLWTALVHRRPPSLPVMGALVLTWAGILLVVGGFDAAAWQRNLTGSLMVLFCATTTATYFLMGERSIAQLGSTGFTVVSMSAATAGVVCWYLATHRLDAVLQVSGQGWLLLLALAVLCMFLPTLLQAEGIQRVGAVRGALAATVGPPASLLFGAALLGERPGVVQLAGTALVIAGIVVLSRPSAT